MSDRVVPGPVSANTGIREAVCVDTQKIYDSCRDRDCIENLRLYPTCASQSAIDRAISLRGGRAEILSAYISVEPAGFQRGYYTVELRFFYRVTAEALVGTPRPVPVCGLAVFDKRVMLYGGVGGVKSYCSQDSVFMQMPPEDEGLPTAVLDTLDPMVLCLRMEEPCCLSGQGCSGEITELPGSIAQHFDGDLEFSPDRRRVYVSLGQFSILRLQRPAQLLLPAYDDCIPCKSCVEANCCDCGDDPCKVFRQVDFPLDVFYPGTSGGNANAGGESDDCNCGCRND